MGERRQVGVIEDDHEAYVVHRRGFGRRNYLAGGVAASLLVAVVAAGVLGDHSGSEARGPHPSQPVAAASIRTAGATGGSPEPTSSPTPSLAGGPPATGMPSTDTGGLTLVPAPAASPDPQPTIAPTVPGAIALSPDPTQIRLARLPADIDVATTVALDTHLYFLGTDSNGQRRSLETLDVTALGGARTLWTAPACHVLGGLAAGRDGIVFSEASGGRSAAPPCASSRITWRVWLLPVGGSKARLLASASLYEPRDQAPALVPSVMPVVAVGNGNFAYSMPTPSIPSQQTVEVRRLRDGRLMWSTVVPGEVTGLMLAGPRLGATLLATMPDTRPQGVKSAFSRPLGLTPVADLALARPDDRARRGVLAATGNIDPRLGELGWAEASQPAFRIVGETFCGQTIASDGAFLAWLDGGPGTVHVAALDSGIEWGVYTGVGPQGPDTGASACGLATGVSAGRRFFIWATQIGDGSFLTSGDGTSQPLAYQPGGAIVWLSVQSKVVLWVALDETGRATAGALDVAAFDPPAT